MSQKDWQRTGNQAEFASTSGNRNSVLKRRKANALFCALLVAAGGTGLFVTTGAQTADQSMIKALSSLNGNWDSHKVTSRIRETTPVLFGEAGMRLAIPPNEASAAADEGVWLSARTLSGTSTETLSLGDPMTIGQHRYVVTELTPLAGPLTKAADAKPMHALTLVVATEVGTENTTAPRRLRFLIDSPARDAIAPQPAVEVRTQGSL